MEATTKKKKFQFPDVYALIFILCCLAMVLTWIIPAGTFERVTEGTLTKVVAGTFQHVDSSPQTPWAMLQAYLSGLYQQRRHHLPDLLLRRVRCHGGRKSRPVRLLHLACP